MLAFVTLHRARPGENQITDVCRVFMFFLQRRASTFSVNIYYNNLHLAQVPQSRERLSGSGGEGVYVRAHAQELHT